MSIQSNYPSIKPSLLLDFANTKQLDSRITFTRASTGSLYDGVTTSKAEENLLTYSQDFDNAAWTKSGTTVLANDTAAPDGTTTADKLTQTSTSNPSARQTVTVAGVCQFSVFLKYVDIRWVRLIAGTGDVWFDIQNGVVGTVSGAGFSASITASTNGFYRCTVSTASLTGSQIFYIIGADADGSVGESLGSYYAWGAQLEQRSAVTAYTATTTQAITNYIPKLQTAASGVARFDHNQTTDESLGLLIEEQRTNLLTYSEQFDNAAWTKTRSSITANMIVAPDGTLTGDKLVEDTTASTTHLMTQQRTGLSAGAAYTFSIYAKAGERSRFYMMEGNNTTGQTWFDLSTGTIVSTTGNGSPISTITPIGNGWYKCTLTLTLVGTAHNCQIRLTTSTTDVYTGDGYSGIYIWGAQLEAGAFATSYIPTVASQVTRSADAASMTGTNFSSWYSADQGTIYSEFNRTFADTSNSGQFVMISDGSATNRMFMQYSASSNFGAFEVIVGGTTQAAINSAAMTIGSYHKMGAAYKVNDIASSVDGATVGTDTFATIPVVNQMSIGNRGYTSAGFLNGTIKKIAYYPLRVTNAQLQALTS